MGTARERHGNGKGTAWVRQGNGIGAARERHGMRELAFRRPVKNLVTSLVYLVQILRYACYNMHCSNSVAENGCPF
jgi:hypothetical protein